MKTTLRHMTALVVTLFIALGAQAQTASQDALYIFRNDGGFNAFFYADIDSMRYSKVDTLGIERGDYIVQEIFALDTLYRIPLDAIDSIAFVTPETKYKADVVRYDRTLLDYVVASDSLYWFRLAPTTPAGIIPKKGDKILIEETNDLMPYGFAGLVTSVEQSADGYMVTTEEVALTELFDQYVAKVATGLVTENALAKERGQRRIDTNMTEQIHIDPITGTLNLTASHGLGVEGLSIDGVTAVGYTFEPDITLRAFCYVGATGASVYFGAKQDYTTAINLGLQAVITGHGDFPLFGKRVDKSGFVFNLSAGFFIEAQASVNLSGSLTQHTVDNSYFAYTTEKPTQAQYDRRKTVLAKEWSCNGVFGKWTLSTGLYAAAEIKLPYSKTLPKGEVVQYGPQDKSGLNGFRLEAGARFEYDVPVTENDIKAMPLIDTPMLYKKINYDNIYHYWFANAQANFSLPWGFNYNVKPEATTDPAGVFGVVPDIHRIQANVDEKDPSIMHLTAAIQRDVLWSTDVGFVIFEKDGETLKQVDSWWETLGWFREDWWDKALYTHAFEGLDPGKTYVAYPQVGFHPFTLNITNMQTYPMLVDQQVEFSLGAPMINIPVKAFEVDENLGYKEDVAITSNITTLEFKPAADWITSVIWFKDKGTLTFFWDDLPASMTERSANIHVTGKDSDGKVVAEEDITVTQMRPTIEFSETTVNVLADGGTRTVTMTKNNMEDVTLAVYDEFIQAVISGKTITIFVDENEVDAPREAVVRVIGTAGSRTTEKYITVKQEAKAGGEAPIPNDDLFTFNGVYVNVQMRNVQSSDGTAHDLSLIMSDTEGTTTRVGNKLRFRADVEKETPLSNGGSRRISRHVVLDIDPGIGASLCAYNLVGGSISSLSEDYDKDGVLVYRSDVSYDVKTIAGRTGVNGVRESGISFSRSGGTHTLDDYIANFKASVLEKKKYQSGYETVASFTSSQGDWDNSKYWSVGIQLALPEGVWLLEPEYDVINVGDDWYNLWVDYVTNLSDVTITSSDEWLKISDIDLDEQEFCVIFRGNHTGAERVGYIYLTGKKPDGTTLTRRITVIQPADNDSYKSKAELPDEKVLTTLEEAGMPVHRGTSAPSITGVYEVSPLVVVAGSNPDEDNLPAGEMGLVFMFSASGDGNVYFNYYTLQNGVPSAPVYQDAGNKACVVGSGNQFTLSWILELTINGKKSQVCILVSGEKDGATIKNMHYAAVNVEGTKTVDGYGIYKDGDSVSPKTEWNPGEETPEDWDDDEDDEDDWDAPRRSGIQSSASAPEMLRRMKMMLSSIITH
ncbi:MAG: hypothetical protein IJ693_09325 [Bacteroidaceae bacterium]|nr:hypothetical protein [Bacteroidaceae bacterium]